MCNEFDKLLCVERSGRYVIYDIPDKLHVGKLYDFRKYDAKQEFGIIYSEKKTGKFYGKRSTIDKFIKEKEYMLCPEGCRLELFTPRADAVYELEIAGKRGENKHEELNLMTLPVRSPKARGFLINGNIVKITHSRYLEEAELAAFIAAAETAPAEDCEDSAVETPEDNAAVETPAENPATIATVEQTAETAAETPAAEPAEVPVEEAPAEEEPAEVPVEEAPAEEPGLNVEQIIEEEPVAEESAEESPAEEEPAPAEEETAPAEESAVAAEAMEDVFVLDSSNTKSKVVRKPAVRHTKVENIDKTDNDLGIVQPDLGF